MEHLINQNVREIEISGIRKFFNLVANYPNAVSLTIGQPDFATPEHVKEAAKRAIEANRTTYTENAGTKDLRQAASAFLSAKYGLSYDPESEIIVTVGASEAIFIALLTLLDRGCEVILPGPAYPGYEPVIKLCGAVPVYIDTRKNEFKMNAALIAEKISDKTRCVILPYPSNPTGCILQEDELREIAELLREKEIFVISDEIYSELVYEGRHRSIAAFPGMREKTIVINGLSKSHAMTGWRIGFACAPASIARHMLKVHQYNVACASSVSQWAGSEALTRGSDDPQRMKEEYKKRRDYVYERLTAIGFDVVKPQGAFYIFPSIEKFGQKSFDFALSLLEKERVAVVPGDAFSAYGEGFIRISYAYALEILEEGLNRIERFVQSL
ncbi:aminotransferase A [Bacillaceae bacterium]